MSFRATTTGPETGASRGAAARDPEQGPSTTVSASPTVHGGKRDLEKWPCVFSFTVVAYDL